MREIFLGDSYDLVKRVWCQTLRDIAPLYAHPRFVPQKLQTKYTMVTGIPMLDPACDSSFGILLDPHTGIPLPQESVHKATASHAPLSFIMDMNEELHPGYIVCFDQSYHRAGGLTRQQQRSDKRRFLSKRGVLSFYYVSHAPFLFAAAKVEILDAIHARLVSIGIPECLFEREA